jgi:hypothetical protein
MNCWMTTPYGLLTIDRELRSGGRGYNGPLLQRTGQNRDVGVKSTFFSEFPEEVHAPRRVSSHPDFPGTTFWN